MAFSAFISLAGSFGAIHYNNIVSHLKDVDLESYKTSAGVDITRAKSDSAKALENSYKLSLQLREEQTSRTTGENSLKASQMELKQQVHGFDIEITPRRFVMSKDVRSKLTTTYKYGDPKQRGGLGFLVECIASDPESCALANDIENAVGSVGFPHGHEAVLGPSQPNPLLVPGVHFGYSNSGKSKNLSEYLRSVFKSANMSADASPVNPIDLYLGKLSGACAGEDCIVVSVGRKK